MMLVSLRRPGRRTRAHYGAIGPEDPTSLGAIVYSTVHHSVHIKTLMPSSGCFSSTSKIIIEIAWNRPYGWGGSRWPSGMRFYSMLPQGWFPESPSNLMCSFLDHLKTLWLKLCEEAHTTISNTVCADSEEAFLLLPGTI